MWIQLAAGSGSGRRHFYWNAADQRVQWEPPPEGFLQLPRPPDGALPAAPSPEADRAKQLVVFNGNKWWKLRPEAADELAQTLKLLLAGAGASLCALL